MKKNRIFSIGALLLLAVVLAACGRSTGSGQFSNQEIRTSWIVDGREYVVCENEHTEFEVRFNTPVLSRVHTAEVEIVGANFGSQTFRFNRSNMSFTDPVHDVVFDFMLRADANPYPMNTEDELSTSAIDIVPVVPPGGGPPAVGGRQTVTVIVRDADGFAIGIFNRSFNVWGACDSPSGAAIHNPEIRTTWIAGGTEHVVCENMATDFEFRFDHAFPNSISRATVLIEGDNFGQQSFTVNRSGFDYDDPDNDLVFVVTLSSTANPYPMAIDDTVDASSIVIVPITPPGGGPPAIGGRQEVTATIYGRTGSPVGTITDRFDVWGACTTTA